LAVISEAVYQGRDLHRFIRELILYLRKLTILQSGEDAEKIMADVPGLKPYLLRHKDKFDSAVLLEMLEILQALTFQLRNSSQPQFLLELSFLRLLRAWRFRQYLSPGTLFQKLEELEEKLQAAGQPPYMIGDTAAGEQHFVAPQGSQRAAEDAARGGGTAAVDQPTKPTPAARAPAALSPPSLTSVPAGKNATDVVSPAVPSGAAAAPGSAGETAGHPPAGPPAEKAAPLPTTPRAEFGPLAGPELQAFWEKQLLPTIKKQRRHVLHALLQEAEPLTCKEGVFTFAFPPTHTIHKSRTESPQHKKYLETLLTTMLGGKTVIRIMLQEKENKKGNEKEGSGESAGGNQDPPASPANNYDGNTSPSTGNIIKDAPPQTTPTDAAQDFAQKKQAKQAKQADDYYMEQMVDLFNGKLLTAGTGELHSRAFWDGNLSLEEE
ncbi:MAG: hypothetical protein ACOX6Z_07745, partial [Dethiobacteria bacterium]